MIVARSPSGVTPWLPVVAESMPASEHSERIVPAALAMAKIFEDDHVSCSVLVLDSPLQKYLYKIIS
jgi:hypothetical protein